MVCQTTIFLYISHESFFNTFHEISGGGGHTPWHYRGGLRSPHPPKSRPSATMEPQGQIGLFLSLGVLLGQIGPHANVCFRYVKKHMFTLFGVAMDLIIHPYHKSIHDFPGVQHLNMDLLRRLDSKKYGVF